MPPKKSTARPAGKQPARPADHEDDDAASSDPFESLDEQDNGRRGEKTGQRGQAAAAATTAEQEPEKAIPRELLVRVLHEFFTKEGTRISRDANAAVGKYMDVFVREAIARAAVERKGGFLEVEDLEKVAPQLLLDL